MSRKDYEAVARELRQLVEATDRAEERRVLAAVVARLARVYAGDNPHFSRGLFVAACGFRTAEVA